MMMITTTDFKDSVRSDLGIMRTVDDENSI